MTEPLIAGLDHVQVCAPPDCEAAARAFFTGVLGLPELLKPERLRANGGAWFGLPDGRQLHVGVERPFAPAGKAHPCLRAPDLDRLTAHLDARGVPWTPDDRAGGRRVYLHDPWGNRLEVVEDRHASVPLSPPGNEGASPH